jgi:hypothetical protein
MDSMEERLDASFALLSSQILQSRLETNGAISAMRVEMSEEFATVRRESAGEFAAVRSEMEDGFALVRSETAGEFAAVRSEMQGGFAAMRSEMSEEFAAVRRESAGEFAAVRSEMSATRDDMQDGFEKLESALVAGLADARSSMLVLHEDLVNRIKVLGEAWPPPQ